MLHHHREGSGDSRGGGPQLCELGGTKLQSYHEACLEHTRESPVLTTAVAKRIAARMRLWQNVDAQVLGSA